MKLSLALYVLASLPAFIEASAVKGLARHKRGGIAVGGIVDVTASVSLDRPPTISSYVPSSRRTSSTVQSSATPSGIVVSPGGLAAIEQALNNIIAALQALADIINDILAQLNVAARSPVKRQSPAANLDAGFAAVIDALNGGAASINGVQGTLTLTQAAELLADQVAIQTAVTAFVNILITNQGVFVQACLGADIEAQSGQLLAAATNLQAAINAKITPLDLSALGLDLQPTIDLINQLLSAYAGQALPPACTASSTTSTTSTSSTTTSSSTSSSTSSTVTVISDGVSSTSGTSTSPAITGVTTATTTATTTTTDYVTITRTEINYYGAPTTFIVICALNDVPCIGPAGVTTVIFEVPGPTATSTVTKTCAVTDTACRATPPPVTPQPPAPQTSSASDGNGGSSGGSNGGDNGDSGSDGSNGSNSGAAGGSNGSGSGGSGGSSGSSDGTSTSTNGSGDGSGGSGSAGGSGSSNNGGGSAGGAVGSDGSSTSTAGDGNGSGNAGGSGTGGSGSGGSGSGGAGSGSAGSGSAGGSSDANGSPVLPSGGAGSSTSNGSPAQYTGAASIAKMDSTIAISLVPMVVLLVQYVF